MNNPTREEFDELKEEVRRLKLQHTEPMKVTRIELDPGGIQNRLDNHAELLKEISDRQDHLDDLGIKTFNEVAKANTEIGLIKGSIIGLRQDMEKRFDSIAEVQKLILSRLPERGN
jgi:HAMP domain-containing protein